jgi:hypothetical protein
MPDPAGLADFLRWPSNEAQQAQPHRGVTRVAHRQIADSLLVQQGRQLRQRRVRVGGRPAVDE